VKGEWAPVSAGLPGSRTVVVIGVGNGWRGDDGAGPEVARRLRAVPPGGGDEIVVRSHEGEGAGLLELWRGAAAVVIVDAVRSQGPPGTIHRLDASSTPLPASLRSASSHAVGVAQAIELARALGRLPERVIVYGIEGESFEAGAVVSEKVASALGALVSAVRQEALALARAVE
jgi:hydrogenase maturation protease